MDYLEEEINNFESISAILAQFGIKIDLQDNNLILKAPLTSLEINKIVNQVFKNELELTFTAQSRIDLATFCFNGSKQTIKNMTQA